NGARAGRAVFHATVRRRRRIASLAGSAWRSAVAAVHTHPTDAKDAERYQTVYARHPGAVAAPTAGLHFDQPMLDALARGGVRRAFVTLHVGAGTFAPVQSPVIT